MDFYNFITINQEHIYLLLFKYLRLEHVAYKTLMSKTPIQLKIINQIKN